MSNPKFQIFVGTNDQFYFRLIAGNGEEMVKRSWAAKATFPNQAAKTALVQ